jgi:N-acetylglucosaminyldiphosphoundecaprenol N-acetyl-beta-D-mannosaminyltransferase
MILTIKVDQVTKEQSLKIVEDWLKEKSKHYITTPNLEIIKAALEDSQLKTILNSSDLSLPDSSRLGWLKTLTEEKNLFKRLLIFPRGFLPFFNQGLIHFDVVTGVDFMESLCRLASEKGYTVGLLGAAPGVAEKTAECLHKKYQNLKVTLTTDDTNSQIPKTDILFIALGQGKQERWISQNLEKIPVKVAMTVGGAFDYLSGNVSRAPLWMRHLGTEWLFRLIVQPWRIKRQLSLVSFLFLLIFKQYRV